MKPLLFYSILVLLFASAIFTGCDFLFPPEEGEEKEQPATVEMDALSITSLLYQDGVDTLTNTDTLDLSLGTFTRPVVLQWQSTTTAISGSVTGNCFLEVDSDGDGANYHRADTAALAAGSKWNTFNLTGGTARCRCISGGTAATKIWNEFWVAPRAPQ